MHRLNHSIAECARQWSLPSTFAKWIFWMPVVGAAVMVVVRLNKDIFRFLLREDGVVEWAQFACFVVACVAGVGAARYRCWAGNVWQGSLFVLFALAMLFAAGEEISWGQRILGLETPEYLKAINKQSETTVHNIGSSLDVFKWIMMAGGALGGTACLLNRRLRLQQYWDQAEFLFVPPVFLAPSFLVVFAYQFIRHTLWLTPSFTVTRYGEWSEFCWSFGLMAFVLLNYRRLRANTEQLEATRDVPCNHATETSVLQR